jgi:hypothetical protein
VTRPAVHVEVRTVEDFVVACLVMSGDSNPIELVRVRRTMLDVPGVWDDFQAFIKAGTKKLLEEVGGLTVLDMYERAAPAREPVKGA